MATLDLRPSPRLLDIVTTLVLSLGAVALGSFLGALYLIFEPATPLWPLWTTLCIAMIVAPIVTAFGAAVRLLSGRMAVWVPLVGIFVVVVLMFGIVVVGLSIEPPPDPGFG